MSTEKTEIGILRAHWELLKRYQDPLKLTETSSGNKVLTWLCRELSLDEQTVKKGLSALNPSNDFTVQIDEIVNDLLSEAEELLRIQKNIKRTEWGVTVAAGTGVLTTAFVFGPGAPIVATLVFGSIISTPYVLLIDSLANKQAQAYKPYIEQLTQIRQKIESAAQDYIQKYGEDDTGSDIKIETTNPVAITQNSIIEEHPDPNTLKL